MTVDLEQINEQIAFVGETLAPFFLQDPKNGIAAPAFEAIESLDPVAAADEWPFGCDEDVARGLCDMHDGLANGLSDALTKEYRRLFIGPTPKPAPPWGSVYTDHECVMFGESALALRGWMCEHGVESHVDAGQPPDHIGLMLTLMAWLARERPELLEEFLHDHFFPWSSHFLDELIEAAEHPFYQGLALLTKSSLEGIQNCLAISVTYPKFYR